MAIVYSKNSSIHGRASLKAVTDWNVASPHQKIASFLIAYKDAQRKGEPFFDMRTAVINYPTIGQGRDYMAYLTIRNVHIPVHLNLLVMPNMKMKTGFVTGVTMDSDHYGYIINDIPKKGRWTQYDFMTYPSSHTHNPQAFIQVPKEHGDFFYDFLNTI
jgi:hypothetical protein